MKELNIPLIIHFDEGIDLLPLLRILMDEPIGPFDHVETDRAQGCQCTTFLFRPSQDPSGGRQRHNIVLSQGKCGTATRPVREFPQFKPEGLSTLPPRFVQVLSFGIQGAARKIEVFHMATTS